MRNRIITVLFCAAVPVLTSCSANRSGWTKDQSTRSAVDQDQAECKYEAEKSTATIGTTSTPKNTTDAVGQGIGDGIVKGMEQSDLISSCMKAKGYKPS